MRAKPSIRMMALAALLLGETALVVSLRRLGWLSTVNGIHWMTCLLAAMLPLALAMTMIFRKRLRFSLRTLLVATALVALFLFITVMPLLETIGSRRASNQLLASGATLHTSPPLEDFFWQLGYIRPSTSPDKPIEENHPVWSQPLAGDTLKIPKDDAIKEIWLVNDSQASILCNNPTRFKNLELILVAPGVSRNAMENLRQTMPEFDSLKGFSLLDVQVPKNWFQSLNKISTLFIWAEGPLEGTPLSTSHLADIAAMPNLEVLYINGYDVNDADVEALTASATLKHVVFRKTAVTELGDQRLIAAMPNCVVHRGYRPFLKDPPEEAPPSEP